MITIQSIKIIAVSVSIVAIIALFALLIQAGMSPMYALLTFLALAAIVCVAYIFSDRLLVAVIGASTRDAPAEVKSAIKQYCEQEHIQVPLAAVVRRSLPDVYVDGIGKNKVVIVITSGAISNFTGRELGEMAITELKTLEKYKTLDMAVAKLVFAPLNRIHELYIHRFCMRNNVTLAGRLNEHTTFRKAMEKDVAIIYRMGFDAFNDTTGFVPLHNLAYRYQNLTTIMMIVEYDGQPAGFTIGHIKHGSLGVYGHGDIMAICKQYRRNGIGRGLMEALMRALAEHGCQQMCFEVWQQNEIAIKLYIDEGFTKRRVIKDFYKEGQNADIMCKKIRAKPVELPISVKHG